MTIREASNLACEMCNTLEKPALVALVEDISGEPWEAVYEHPTYWVAGWILEAAGYEIVRETGTGMVLSAVLKA
jgi:hypothetical protein